MTSANRFHFTELQVPASEGSTSSREAAQRLVHGLLGQRAIMPPTTRSVRASNRAMSRQLARGIVEPFFGEVPTERERAMGLPSTSAAAGLTGLDRRTASTLSAHGEGAIEGLHRHYRVRSLHSHDFRYSRFNCSSTDAPGASGESWPTS